MSSFMVSCAGVGDDTSHDYTGPFDITIVTATSHTDVQLATNGELIGGAP